MDNIFIRCDCYILKKFFPKKNLITIEDLICLAEDLDAEKEQLEEQFEDFKKIVDEQYQKVPERRLYE